MKLSREVKTGILVAIAIGLFIYGFNILKGRNIFSSGTTYYAVYNNIQGLVPNGAVTLNGMRIGQVKSTDYLEDNSGRIRVTIVINNNDVKVPKGSVAKIVSEMLVGTSVQMFLSANKEIAPDGDTLKGEVQAGLMDQLAPLQVKVSTLVSSIDSVVTDLNDVLTPQTKNDLRQSIGSLKKMLTTFEKTSVKLDNIVDTKLATILTKVESITTNLANNNKKITDILTGFAAVSDSLSKSNLKSAVDNANVALSQFASTMEKINKGEGSIGLLVNDKKLYNNLDSASASLDQLLKDFKERPKRYVHFSIFGRKDK